MAYVIMRRQIGDYVARAPYVGIEKRYVEDIDDARKFSRYVDAFNNCRGNETVREI